MPILTAHVDEHSNLIPKYVKRPEVMSKYFQYNDVIDNINSQRQKDLALEKKWVTQDGVFSSHFHHSGRYLCCGFL